MKAKNGFNLGLPTGISALRAFNSLAKPSTVNLGLGKPWEDMPPELRPLAREIIANKQDYTENAGLLSVRLALEKRYSLAPGSTILTHGAQEGIFATMLALLNPGDEVLIPDPGFLAYAPMVRSLHAKALFYPLEKRGNNFHFDPDAILRAAKKKTKLLVLNAPGNPVATLTGEMKYLLKELKKRDIRVLSDEVYGELIYHGDFEPLALQSKLVVSINAFSKSHALTGWRIGWLSCQDPEMRKRALVAHQYISTCASVPAQHLVGALLANEKLFNSIRDRYRAEYKAKCDLFYSKLGANFQNLEKPEAGFYAFLPIPKKSSGSLAYAKYLLKKYDVLVIPGEFFGSQGKRFVRVSFAVPEEKLLQAIAALNNPAYKNVFNNDF